MLFLRLFPTYTSTQVAATSSFTTDLGLDSLDAVEVVMAIEEEFTIVSTLILSSLHIPQSHTY